MVAYVAGVDGGATKTVCLISDAEGNVVASGKAGPANWHNVGLLKACQAIRQAVRSAKDKAGLKARRLSVACFGLAAMDSPKDFKIMRRRIGSLRLARRSLVVHDSVIALMGATEGSPGVIVIAGTGCVSAGVNAKGEYVRVGGWGYVLDDEGSAYDVGRKALRAVLRYHDGRGQPTILKEKVMRALGLEYPEGIVEAVHIKGMGVAGIASLAPLVAEAAAEGDAVSRGILREAGEALGALAGATAVRLSMAGEAFPVALVGGLFRSGEFILKPFEEALRAYAPMARLIEPTLPPAAGALMLALKEHLGGLSQKVLDRLKRSLQRWPVEIEH